MKTRILSLVIITIGMMMMSFVSAPTESNYHVASSNAFISGSAKSDQWKVNIKSANCKGVFTIEDNELSDIQNLSLGFTLDQLQSASVQSAESLITSLKGKNCEEIEFKQQRVMILPIMKMIHMIGEVKIGDRVNSVPMQMSTEANEDGSITLNAKQFVKLSSFGISLPNTKPGDAAEEVIINVSLKLEKSNS
ncbi:hypothetical protein [Pedobacter boryungensis]|uniref:Lipid/polyisoprenoid-binding YceI-like domain-containing protein n=1 Tax=Pedobacter boryungensis TaxID=869962 RepID=A0ABX2DAR8_9SPHI|nr:hypothetical protein [Pedobacter boryungensis]NQX31065.1 hypothetical protein [Pedobacter boryungensis]